MPLKLKKRGRFWHITGTVNGQRVRESTNTAEKSRADTIRAKREWELEQGRVFGPKSTLTFGAAVAKYLDAGGSPRFITRIFNKWKDRLVSDIKPGDVRKLARELYPNASVETWRRQVVVPVRAIINHSADLGLCDPIRVKAFTAPERKRQHAKIGKRTYRAKAVNRAWLDAFISAAPPKLGALALFMHTTGARITESVDLPPRCVDLAERIAVLEDGKGGDDGIAFLTQEVVVAFANLDMTGDKVFGFPRRQSVYGPWKAACEKAGIPYITPHEAGRHSFATHMIVQMGKDVDSTAQLGRWKSKRLLMETYVHGDADHAVIDEVFGSKSGKN